MSDEFMESCPKCGVQVGQQHDFCSAALCKNCGFSCTLHNHFARCDNNVPIVWTGYWPGYVECVEWGWTESLPSRFKNDKVDLVSFKPDYNRMHREHLAKRIIWDSDKERFFLNNLCAQREDLAKLLYEAELIHPDADPIAIEDREYGLWKSAIMAKKLLEAVDLNWELAAYLRHKL